MVDPTHLHDLEGLDFAGVLDVRATAQVNQGTATVDGTLLPGNQLVNVVKLVLAVREHLLEVLFRDLQPIEALLLLEDPGSPAIEGSPVGLAHDTSIAQLLAID